MSPQAASSLLTFSQYVHDFIIIFRPVGKITIYTYLDYPAVFFLVLRLTRTNRKPVQRTIAKKAVKLFNLPMAREIFTFYI